MQRYPGKPTVAPSNQTARSLNGRSSTGPREQTVCPESVNGVVVGEAGRALGPILTKGGCLVVGGMRAGLTTSVEGRGGAPPLFEVPGCASTPSTATRSAIAETVRHMASHVAARRDGP